VVAFSIASVLLGAACGSTVSPEAFRAAAQRGQDGGLAIGPDGGGLGQTVGAPLPEGSAGGPLGGSTSGPTGPTGPAGNLPAALGPGITASTIFLGAAYNINQAAANAALGGGARGAATSATPTT
jgi:hypothetical protein